MIGAVLKLIIFTSMVNRIINTSRNERVTQQVYDTYLQMFDVCTLALSHSFHAFFWHTRPSCTFSFTKTPSCPKLLIPASNAIGRWGITVELSPECPLNRNNWFMLHKMQYTKRFLLRSRHYSFVPSHCASAQNLNTCSFIPYGKLTSMCVLKVVMADWNRSNHFDTPCILHQQMHTTLLQLQ